MEAEIGTKPKISPMPQLSSQGRPKVKVIDACRTFHSSVDFRGTIEILLAGISPGYLAGLDRIVLRDSDGLTRREKKKRERHPGKVLLGTYYRKSRKSAPYVDLFIDVIAQRWPPMTLRFALLRQILLASVLFHELGHHIHSEIVPEFKSREPTAEAWRIRLTREFFQREYPLLMFLLKPLATMVKRAQRKRQIRAQM